MQYSLFFFSTRINKIFETRMILWLQAGIIITFVDTRLYDIIYKTKITHCVANWDVITKSIVPTVRLSYLKT